MKAECIKRGDAIVSFGRGNIPYEVPCKVPQENIG